MLAGGCIGVSQKRGSPSTAEATTTPLINRCRTDAKPIANGMLDDFEDGNNQLTNLEARDGYWWKAQDDFGSAIEFKMDEHGAGGSEMALHATGKTVTGGNDTWGAQVGVNLLTQQGGLYDGSRYAGISFKAKVAPGSARDVRFKIGDINTHKDGGVCTTCWNLFGKDLTLTTEWKEYRVMFASAEQEPGWGNPRPPSVSPNKLIAINWTVGPGKTFDLWIDDVTFLACE
jgi:hypothetical protein